jgi:phosphoglycolate phosphatase
VAQPGANAAAPLQAVLLDLDGTLMDTVPDLAEAANRVRGDFGLEPLPASLIAQFVGKGADVLVHRSLSGRIDGQLDAVRFAAARESFGRHYHAVNGSASVVFAGAFAALERMRRLGWRLACVTNKPREFTLPLLQRAGLAERLDAVVCSDEVPHRKPHPAIVLEACARLRVTPAQAAMIGDSDNDAQAACAAGVRVVLVQTGYNEGEPLSRDADRQGVDAIVAGLAEAVDVLERAAA